MSSGLTPLISGGRPAFRMSRRVNDGFLGAPAGRSHSGVKRTLVVTVMLPVHDLTGPPMCQSSFYTGGPRLSTLSTRQLSSSSLFLALFCFLAASATTNPSISAVQTVRVIKLSLGVKLGVPPPASATSNCPTRLGARGASAIWCSRRLL